MKNQLSIYFTAGYPELNSTQEILLALQEAEVDLIEIGIPFSDPLADGPTIQRSSEIALKNGVNLKLIFDQIAEVKNEIKIPMLMMGYLNSVMQYGTENFCKKCLEIGIKGVILPDLPVEVYLKEFKAVFEKYKVKCIFLVTPQTSDERLKLIDSVSDWFIYAVSSNSITGNLMETDANTIDYFKRLKALNLKNPFLIGFGISDNRSFEMACNYGGGAIIGSAFIRNLPTGVPLKENIKKFVLNTRFA